MTASAALTGWGHFLPETVLTNQDLALLVETSDTWIRERTGIRERHVVSAGETTSSMCIAAARRALERAELAAADLDLVICATTTPDHLCPATSCMVRERLGAANAGAFDLNSACTGFLSAFITGAQFVQAGTCRRVLVVAGETLSRFTNWSDRSTCVLLGDGAGAVVLEADEHEGGVLGTVLGCQGDLDHLLTIEAGGSAVPASATTIANGSHYLRMQGSEVFRLAVRAMHQASTQALARAGVALSDVATVIAHQANLRIIDRTREALGVPAEKMFVNVDRCGNTGAASVAIALAEHLDATPPVPGSHLLLVAFGGGLTWAAAVVRAADIGAVMARRGFERFGAPRGRKGTILAPRAPVAPSYPNRVAG